MNAIVVREFGASNVLKLISGHPIPSPKANQILVKVKSAGVNPVDTYIRSGAHIIKPNLPYIPGKDVSGEVAQLGSNDLQGKFNIGDRVFARGALTGGYAEYCLVSASSCFPLPSNLTHEQGASLGVPAFTAYRALFIKGDAKPGDFVLVHGGSGAVGVCAIQMAVAHGCKVIGTAGTEEGMKMILGEGASYAFNHREDIVEKVMEVTNGSGVQLILEMLANKNLAKDCQMASKNGKIVVIGSRGSLDFDPRFTMANEICIQGIALINSSEEEQLQQSRGIQEKLKQNIIRPIIGKKFPLSEAKEAHDYVIHNTGSLGKVVLVCDD